MKLDQLSIGDNAIVKGFEDDDLGLILNEMGILVGEVIEISGKAPLGDPLCIKNEESMISIRHGEAKKVLVEKI